MTEIRSAPRCYMDTDTSVEELVEAFGGPNASPVQEVTDDKRLPGRTPCMRIGLLLQRPGR